MRIIVTFQLSKLYYIYCLCAAISLLHTVAVFSMELLPPIDTRNQFNWEDQQDSESEIEKGDPLLMAYVINKYEKNLFGLAHLFYPAKSPKKLYIIFNSATKNRYSMWSWFWESDEKWDDTAFLFLKDDTTKWYLGTPEQSLISSYTNVINHYLKKYKLDSSQVSMIGGSMGGYAALLYGMQLGVGAVFAFRPQIDYQNALLNFGVRGLKENWIDLNEQAQQVSNLPKIYLTYGNFLPDKQAAHQFINTLKEMSSIVIYHKTSHPLHKGFYPTKGYLMATLLYLERVNHEGFVNAGA